MVQQSKIYIYIKTSCFLMCVSAWLSRYTWSANSSASFCWPTKAQVTSRGLGISRACPLSCTSCKWCLGTPSFPQFRLGGGQNQKWCLSNASWNPVTKLQMLIIITCRCLFKFLLSVILSPLKNADRDLIGNQTGS